MTEYDETLPESGMATGSDAGNPGDRLGDTSLTPAERNPTLDTRRWIQRGEMEIPPTATVH